MAGFDKAISNKDYNSIIHNNKALRAYAPTTKKRDSCSALKIRKKPKIMYDSSGEFPKKVDNIESFMPIITFVLLVNRTVSIDMSLILLKLANKFSYKYLYYSSLVNHTLPDIILDSSNAIFYCNNYEIKSAISRILAEKENYFKFHLLVFGAINDDNDKLINTRLDNVQIDVYSVRDYDSAAQTINMIIRYTYCKSESKKAWNNLYLIETDTVTHSVEKQPYAEIIDKYNSKQMANIKQNARLKLK